MLTVDDLLTFLPNLDEAKAEAMIEDALALAAVIAPCIFEPDFVHEGAARAILRGAILRWADQGSGAQASLTAGPFSVAPQTQVRRSLFYPSEISELQGLCGRGRGRAFAIDTWGPVEEVGS